MEQIKSYTDLFFPPPLQSCEIINNKLEHIVSLFFIPDFKDKEWKQIL